MVASPGVQNRGPLPSSYAAKDLVDGLHCGTAISERSRHDWSRLLSCRTLDDILLQHWSAV
jgi:hypothetical protein